MNPGKETLRKRKSWLEKNLDIIANGILGIKETSVAYHTRDDFDPSIAAVVRIAKKSGAQRVSYEAATALVMYTEPCIQRLAGMTEVNDDPGSMHFL